MGWMNWKLPFDCITIRGRSFFFSLSRKALGHSASYLVGTGSSLPRWWHGKILHMPVCLLGSMPNCAQVVPLQAWSGQEGSRKLRFPDFMTTAQDGGKVVNLTHQPPLPPGNCAQGQLYYSNMTVLYFSQYCKWLQTEWLKIRHPATERFSLHQCFQFGTSSLLSKGYW